jgi:hypothetical protein
MSIQDQTSSSQCGNREQEIAKHIQHRIRKVRNAMMVSQIESKGITHLCTEPDNSRYLADIWPKAKAIYGAKLQANRH